MAKPSPVSLQVRDRILMLYEAPYSMSLNAIAEHEGLTRNQVAGIVHRAAKAGEVRDREGQGMKPTFFRKKPAVPAPVGPAQGSEPAAPPDEQLEEGVKPALVPPPLPASATVFRERKPSECQWPTSNGRPWTFCCAETLPGRPYCAAHAMQSLDHRKMAQIEERRAQRRAARAA